jgi:hypothetical protein
MKRSSIGSVPHMNRRVRFTASALLITSLTMAAGARDLNAAGTAIPTWLQGRASDTQPAPPIYSSTQIAALFQRPSNVSELLRNLKLAWDKKLLVQPAFFDDANLLTFFNGTSITWKKPRPNTKLDIRNRTGTVTVNDRVFPNVMVSVWIHHELDPAIRQPGAYFPAHAHDAGSVQLRIGTLPPLTWEVVKGVFGPDAQKLNADIPSPHAVIPRSGKVVMRYVYSGDDPSKFGEGELPQARFLLEQGLVSAPPTLRDQPQDSDTIRSIYMLESVNRR